MARVDDNSHIVNIMRMHRDRMKLSYTTNKDNLSKYNAYIQPFQILLNARIQAEQVSIIGAMLTILNSYTMPDTHKIILMVASLELYEGNDLTTQNIDNGKSNLDG